MCLGNNGIYKYLFIHNSRFYKSFSRNQYLFDTMNKQYYPLYICTPSNAAHTSMSKIRDYDNRPNNLKSF